MAPKSKREVLPEEPAKVCKRLKDEPVTEAKDKVEANNNVTTKKTSTDNGSANGSVSAAPKDKTKEDKVKPESEKPPKPELDHDEDDEDSPADESEDEQGDKSPGQSDSDNKKKGETNGKETDSKPSVTDAKPDSKESVKPTASPEPEDEPSGTLLMCGGADWDMTGRKELPKTAKKATQPNPAARNLWAPHKVAHSGKQLRVKMIASGCNACHSVIVTDEGDVMTFGRNDKGQLGVGDTETRVTPTLIEAFRGINIVAAACGRSHTLFLDSNGIVYSCGDNKMGQCGTNQMAVQQITTPTRIAFKENKPVVRIACGAEFSMIVDIDGRLYSFGHPEHGQLGHNSEGKYFTSGNKYAFHCEYAPRRITTFIEKSREGHVSPVGDVSIVDIACGTNHTLAVDKKHRCFSWGFAGYHRLGHSETKNELVPRSIKVFDAPTSSGRGAVKVFAGATHSMALDMNGLLYFWGQNKSSGEATMYPKNVQDLCGWRIKAVSCANRSIFVIAEDMCISWGPSPTYGELGYGEGKSKSSTTPQEVKTLDGVQVINVACGFGHTLLIARDQNEKDLEPLKTIKTWP